jgi:hypothetical protein
VLRGPSAPPLQSWPDRADGTSPAELAVPLDLDSAATERASWGQLPSADRLFLAAVLEAWPELVAGLDPAGLQAAGGAAAVEAAAQALRDRARVRLGPDGALRHTVPPPSLLRRAARRLRGRPPQGGQEPT